MTQVRSKPGSRAEVRATFSGEDIAEVLTEVADLLAIKDENPFKIRAYQAAAEAIQLSGLTFGPETDLEELLAMRGVGRSIAEKVKELLEVGSISYLEELKKELPESLLELLQIPTLGPKKVGAIYRELGIRSLDELEDAARAQKIRALRGFGATVEANILHGIEFARSRTGRHLLDKALAVASRIVSSLQDSGLPGRAEYAGSLRRGKETIGDIDIVATCARPAALMKVFVEMPDVAEVVAHGETKSSLITDEGVQVDLRVVQEGSYGAALLYFTGSQSHNIHLRGLANDLGLKINEYGVFEEASGKFVGGETEEDVYAKVGLEWISPCLREDAGELEAAKEGCLPHLVQHSDIRGDLHLHTYASDGAMTLEEAALTVADLGYEYLGISDHTKALGVASGLNEEQLLNQAEQIAAFNDSHPDAVRLLSGCEVNILADGRPDIEPEVLEQMDFVIGSVHTALGQSQEKMTERLLAAIKDDNIDAIGHPTNRILGKREESKFDLETVFEAAIKHRTALEINCWPERLDLPDAYLRRARGRGLPICINTDSHRTTHLTSMMKYGIMTAQRGWVEPEQVINTFPLERLLRFLRRRG